MRRKSRNILFSIWLCLIIGIIIAFATVVANAKEDLFPGDVSISSEGSSMSPNRPEPKKETTESEEEELKAKEEKLLLTTRGPLQAPSKIILPKEELK